MDSGNSGSMQSSGGDDDYDSRAAADSSFICAIYNPSLPQPPTMYDSSNNLSNFLNPPISSRLQFQHNQINSHFFRPQSQTLLFPPHHFVTAPPSNETGGVSASSSQPNDQDQTTPRNPKKRSRASRRAPTTVLTTDTTNFRAMVQEFTGIPAPPFSPVPKTRLDLFSTPSASIRSNFKFSQTPSHNTLLLRPLPQKLQPPPSYSNFLDDANNNTILSCQSPLVFHNSSELGLLKYQQRGMSQMQNPNQSSFLQSSSYNSSIFGSKTEHDFSLGMPLQPNLQNIGALEEFGQVSNAQVTRLPDLISPENCNNFLPNLTNGKQNNYSLTNLRDEKGTTDNVSMSATRGTSEGMMEPWICSSD